MFCVFLSAEGCARRLQRLGARDLPPATEPPRWPGSAAAAKSGDRSYNMDRLLAASLVASAAAFGGVSPPVLKGVGITAPFGNAADGTCWDPVGFTTRTSDPLMLWYRAAELKHSRVAMLASAGWIVNGLHLSRARRVRSFAPGVPRAGIAARRPLKRSRARRARPAHAVTPASQVPRQPRDGRQVQRPRGQVAARGVGGDAVRRQGPDPHRHRPRGVPQRVRRALQDALHEGRLLPGQPAQLPRRQQVGGRLGRQGHLDDLGEDGRAVPQPAERGAQQRPPRHDRRHGLLRGRARPRLRPAPPLGAGGSRRDEAAALVTPRDA